MKKFKDIVVQKPWGHEYLLYENDKVGIWYLFLKHDARTSLHNHINKKTGLIVLSGDAQVSFMNGSHLLKPCDKIIIRNGVFHSTKALSNGLELLEIETPNDKEDIVRLEDAYGRAGTPYESEKFYTKDNFKYKLKDKTKIGNCLLSFVKTQNKEDLIDRENSKIMVLDGQVFYKEHPICSHGDIVDNVTLSRLVSKFDATPMHLLEIKLENQS